MIAPADLTREVTYYTYTLEQVWGRVYVGSLPSQSKAQTVYYFQGEGDYAYRVYDLDLRHMYFPTQHEAQAALVAHLEAMVSKQALRLEVENETAK